MPERLLTTAEVQRRLACSRTQIHYYRQDGDFPRPIKLGRSVRFREADLDRWIRDRANPGPDGDSRSPAQTREDAASGPTAPAGDVRPADREAAP